MSKCITFSPRKKGKTLRVVCEEKKRREPRKKRPMYNNKGKNTHQPKPRREKLQEGGGTAGGVCMKNVLSGGGLLGGFH